MINVAFSAYRPFHCNNNILWFESNSICTLYPTVNFPSFVLSYWCLCRPCAAFLLSLVTWQVFLGRCLNSMKCLLVYIMFIISTSNDSASVHGFTVLCQPYNCTAKQRLNISFGDLILPNTSSNASAISNNTIDSGNLAAQSMNVRMY